MREAKTRERGAVVEEKVGEAETGNAEEKRATEEETILKHNQRRWEEGENRIVEVGVVSPVFFLFLFCIFFFFFLYRFRFALYMVILFWPFNQPSQLHLMFPSMAGPWPRLFHQGGQSSPSFVACF